MTKDKGRSFSTLEDCHESRDALRPIQGDWSPGVTPIRPGSVCRVLDLMRLLVKHIERLSLLASSNLDFIWAICAVLWGNDGGIPSVKICHERGLGRAPSHNILFFDQDVRANRPCLVKEGRTTCAEEFRDVDSGCADELILAAHRNFVRRHGIF